MVRPLGFNTKPWKFRLKLSQDRLANIFYLISNFNSFLIFSYFYLNLYLFFKNNFQEFALGNSHFEKTQNAFKSTLFAKNKPY